MVSFKEVSPVSWAWCGVAVSPYDDEFDHVCNFFRMLPPGERFPLVEADDEIEPGVLGVELAENGECFPGVGWGWVFEFEGGDRCPGVVGEGELQHC